VTARRVVIIGSGLAGLTSALLLAEDGWDVTVLEQHTIPGGLMQRYRRGGCWFDTGFHLATGSEPGGVLRAILARLGVLDRVRFLDPAPQAQILASTPGVEPLAIPVGLESVAEAACARFPQQADAIRRFFALLRGRLAHNVWLRVLVPGAPPCELPHADCSVDDALTHCGVHGEPARLLGAASAILAMRPEACPFDLYAAFAGSTFAGGWRIAGGGDGLVAPLVERLRALGGRLLTGCGATVIRHDGSRAEAVVDVRGQAHPCDLVIATCHPDVALRLAGEDAFRPSFKARLAEIPDSRGAFMLAATLTRSAVELGASHHFLRLDDGRDLYLVAPDQWDPGLPPSLEAMVWIDPAEVAAWRASRLGQRPAEYQAWKEREQTRLLAVIAEHFPGLERAVQRVWPASPLTFRDYLGGRHGGAMGLSHDIGHLGSAPFSPRNKLRNLLLAGQNISHPGILGTLIGAMVTAGAVLQRDLRRETLEPDGG
jgi:all-trans-retinol 13,14-reductase